MELVVLSKVSTRGEHRFAEVRLTRGPRVIGETGDNSFPILLGYAWKLVADARNNSYRLFQGVDIYGNPALISEGGVKGWKEQTMPQPPHPPSAVRHVDICFDQAARPVLAYELDGQIYVNQWDPTTNDFVLRGPFPGVDPVLIWDFEVGYYLPDSDVLLLHLSPDRTQVVMRVQRELYNTPHVLETLPEPAYLDQVVALPYQAQMLGSLSSSPTTTSLIMRTDIYPVYVSDQFPASAQAPTGWNLIPVVVTYDVGMDSFAAELGAPLAWDYILAYTIVSQDLGTDTWGTANMSPPLAWDYVPMVVVRDLGTDTWGTANMSPPAEWSYPLVVTVVDLTGPNYTPTGYEDLGTATMSPPTAWSYDPA